jgi:tetratricopeptide (TPR) repeat protein
MVPPAATEEVEVAVETIGPEAPPVPEEGPIVVLQEPSTKEEDAFLTETIADLYVKQGLYDRAIEIFSKLLSADPDNPHFQERLQEVTLLQKGGGTAEPSAVAQTEETEEPEKEEPEKEEEERVGQISLVEEDLVSESVPPPIPASVAEEAREPEVSEYETMASPEEETPPQLSRGRPSPETLHRWLEAIKQRRKLMGTEWDSEND